MSGFAKSKKDMQMTLSTQAASSAYSQWFNALKDKADIQDYRGKLFRD
jgi:hypothetical protein